MRANALRCIANTHREEGSDTPSGGWTIDRNDRGNWTGGAVGKGELKGTKWGIAANTYPDLDIRNLTRAQADAIYIRDYWTWAYGDLWPAGIDQVTYDATVNSGRGRGPLWTCRALGFANDNPATVRAAATKAHALDTDGRIGTVKKACGNRLSFLQGLKGPSGWPRFGRGWGGRVARMEALGVKMVLEDAKASPVVVDKRLEQEAGKAKTTSNTAGAGGVTGTAAGGGGATQMQPPSDAIDWIIAGSVTVIAIGTIGACIWIWWKHRERAKAYLQVARGYFDEARTAAAGAIGG